MKHVNGQLLLDLLAEMGFGPMDCESVFIDGRTVEVRLVVRGHGGRILTDPREEEPTPLVFPIAVPIQWPTPETTDSEEPS